MSTTTGCVIDYGISINKGEEKMDRIQKFNIRNDKGDLLFEGFYKTIKDCVEHAVQIKTDLSYANLSGLNLSQVNMDDGIFFGANFRNTNLNAANLSEAVFDNACFENADVTFACFAISSLKNVNFVNASFGHTDVTDATISGCRFSCPSIFTTHFHRAELFKDCVFIHRNNNVIRMSRAPITIHGLPCDITYVDQHVRIGNDFVLKGDLIAAGERHLQFIYGANVTSFLQPVMHENTVFL